MPRCLHNGFSASDLITAVRATAAGKAFLSPDLTATLFQSFRLTPAASANLNSSSPLAELSQREIEVLRWVAEGISNRQISRKLQVSETTIKTHVSHILTKLGLSTRVQAARLAWQIGLVAV
ncbi:response regulator transcription factor [Streptomyces sp. NPDC001515]